MVGKSNTVQHYRKDVGNRQVVDTEALKRHLMKSPEAKAIRKQVLDAFSPLLWQLPQQTSISGYRWKGEDTLNWGDPNAWAEISLLQCWIENPGACLEQYWILQGMAAFTRDLQGLEKMCLVRNATAVHRFLQIHPDLMDVLVEARHRVLEHFGPETQVALELVRDPEVENWDELFAYIITPLPVDQALICLEKLDKEWFLDQVDRTGDLFNLNLECV